MKITNTTTGIKSIWSRSAVAMVSVGPGETVEADIHQAEQDADVAGYFKFEGEAKRGPGRPPKDPLDHDGNGVKGGAKPAID